MHLKSLEIKGFKSFADRTKIEFPKGIISVVGPNGSGKSNILDSVLWVLGEQSYKNIRAKEGADVIFSGGKNKKPFGMAEVALIIDNEDRALAIEYSEVKIERRIYMSGENEYLINGSRVRLKDIQELFMDTGIGKTAYSVIGQGKVEEILISTPRDLKGLIEEAAGIKRFKKRKEEAEVRLKEVDDNIEKIEYIELEIAEILEPLKIQAEKAKQYKELREIIRVGKAALLKRDRFFTDNLRKGVRVRKEDNEKNFAIQTEIFNKADAEIKEITENIQSIENIMDMKEESERALKNEIQALSNDEILYSERLKNLEKEKNEKESILAEYTEKYNVKLEKITQIKKENMESEERIKNEEAAINSINEKQKNLINEKNSLNSEMKKIKEDIMDFEIEKIKTINEVESNDKNIKLIKQRIVKLQEEIDEYKKQESGNEEIIKQKHSDKASVMRKREEAVNRKLSKEGEIRAAVQFSGELKREIEAIEGKYQNNKIRKDTLQNMDNNYEGFFKGVKEILNSGIEGVVGPFISVVDIPEKLETAMEAAVGNSMQDIVVSNSDTAKKCIEFLKKNNFGRASFLPFDTIKVYDIKNKPTGKGILGLASELVKYKPEYEKVIKFVLGNILIVENIDSAVEVFKNSGFTGTIVSLEGEIISGRGKISGGEKIKSGMSAIFDRKREIIRLGEMIEEILRNAAEKKKTAEESYAKLERMRTELEEEDKNILAILENEKNIDYEIENIKKNIQQIKRNILVIEEEKEEETKRNVETENRNRVNHRKMEELNVKICASKDHIAEKEIKLIKIGDSIEEISNEFSESRMEFVKIKEKYLMTKEKLDEEERNFLDLEKQKSSYITKIRDICAEQELYTANLTDIKLNLSDKNGKHVLELETLKKEKEKYRELESLEKKKILELKDAENKINNERSLLNKHTREYEKAEAEIAEIDRILAELGDIEAIQMATDDSGLKKEIAKAEDSVKKLGDINLLAIEEYERTNAKHEFITKQKSDLTVSRASLRTFIKEIEKDIVEKFTDAYNEIRKNFIYTCEEVLNNAKGDIILNNPDNILETGAELEVKFKNKKSQTLTLLSGGEKSMVAVAFIMAIFMYRPSPFTFFDEIEAALDESNTKKLLKMLKNFTSESQFILITHNKETMRESDVLYGVTMNKEEGVSKIVSVKV